LDKYLVPMVNFSNIPSKIKKKINSRLERIKKPISLPPSKRKSALLGFVGVCGLFGVSLLGLALPAIAKDIPVSGPNHCSAPAPVKQSDELAKAISGAAASVCLQVPLQSAQHVV